MGVTISSKKHSIDIGYGSFCNLRKLFAEQCSQEIGELYRNAIKLELSANFSGNEYLQVRQNLIKEFRKLNIYRPDLVHNFLFASDASGKRSPQTCKALLKVIEPVSDDLRIGYQGRKDCATIKNLKQILQDCIEDNSMLQWY